MLSTLHPCQSCQKYYFEWVAGGDASNLHDFNVSMKRFSHSSGSGS